MMVYLFRVTKEEFVEVPGSSEEDARERLEEEIYLSPSENLVGIYLTDLYEISSEEEEKIYEQKLS